MKKIAPLFLLILAFACNAPRHFILSGEYDSAIEKLVRKLSHNHKSDKNMLLLEEAYQKGQQKDLEQIDFLRKDTNKDNWVEITGLYLHMKRRQELVSPLIPLHIKSLNRDANIKTMNVDELLIAAKSKAADYLYSHGKELLAHHTRIDARLAYEEFKQVKFYTTRYTDIDKLITDAKYLGTNKVLFRFENNSNKILPVDFEAELLKISLTNLNGNWVQYSTVKNAQTKYDYEIIAHVKQITVSPEQFFEKEYSQQKTVKDGFEYVLDAKGNVKKDSLGNDIKKEKYKTITCDVKETRQFKMATVECTVDYFDVLSKELQGSFPVKTDAVFENFSARIKGDANALDDATRAMIGHQVVPFPTELDLLSKAVAQLKPLIKQVLDDKYNLVAN